MKENLPIFEVLPRIKEKLKENNRLVIQAPPGAGKTTALPLELLGESWLGEGKVLMLEPRRIATRSASYWMAKSLGEPVGQKVGYSVHLDRKVSDNTVLEVITEGVFLNRIVKDPGLEGVSLVIFDEFHERSVDADLSLALVREVQEVLREDLKVMVMSATLDADPIAAFLHNAPVITSEGKCFPVEIRYDDGGDRDPVSHAVSVALATAGREKGSILLFLPGAGEIKRAQSLLEERLPSQIPVFPLYGSLSSEQQERAIEPVEDGQRKIVLATPIAESSITIKGIRIVIDTGLVRQPRYNARTGMDSLETLFISKASAEQRAGRAGRVEPGICIRLWPSHRKLDSYAEPGIEMEDLSSLTLILARWGYADTEDLEWLTPPNSEIFRGCRELLIELGAVDSKGITDRGEKISRLPLHPRLGAMILEGERKGCKKLASDLAALLSERDILSFPGGDLQSDIHYRLEVLEGKRTSAGRLNGPGLKWVREYSHSLCNSRDENREVSAGALLLSAFPDRVARNLGDGLLQLSNGSNAVLSKGDVLYYSPFLAVPALGGTGRTARVFLAAPVTEEEIFDQLKERISLSEELIYHRETGKFRGIRQKKLVHLVLKEERLREISDESFRTALLSYLAGTGLGDLNWNKETVRFRDRVSFLHRQETVGFPDMSDDALTGNLNWLEPYLGGITIKNKLADIPLLDALNGMLDWNTINRLDDLAPTHITVPSGSHIPVDYSENEPVLKVRIQEMFGLTETPALCGGSWPLTIHLLSPASRPIQITRDLKSFWDNTYEEVKKDLKGRYPKHYWPDNPYEAEPTNRAKRRK